MPVKIIDLKDNAQFQKAKEELEQQYNTDLETIHKCIVLLKQTKKECVKRFEKKYLALLKEYRSK